MSRRTIFNATTALLLAALLIMTPCLGSRAVTALAEGDGFSLKLELPEYTEPGGTYDLTVRIESLPASDECVTVLRFFVKADKSLVTFNKASGNMASFTSTFPETVSDIVKVTDEAVDVCFMDFEFSGGITAGSEIKLSFTVSADAEPGTALDISAGDVTYALGERMLDFVTPDCAETASSLICDKLHTAYTGDGVCVSASVNSLLRKGDTYKLALTLSSVPNSGEPVTAVRFKVGFDPRKVTLLTVSGKEAAFTTDLPTSMDTIITVENNYADAMLMDFTLGGIFSEGKKIELEFTVNEAAADGSEVRFDIYNVGYALGKNMLSFTDGGDIDCAAEICTVIPNTLSFASNGDGTCFVDGIGTCTDTNVVIPSVSPYGETVTGIGAFAFQGASVVSVTIPETVTAVADGAFAYCPAITSFTADGNSVYQIKNGCITESSGTRLVAACKASVIPEGTTAIAPYAFAGITSLKTLSVPRSLLTVGKNAFDGCTGLTDVSYPYFRSGWNKISVAEGNGCLTSAALHALVAGDADGDGAIGIMDYISIRLHIIGVRSITGLNATAADVNENGHIDTLDYIALRLHILGISLLVK